MEFVGDGFLYKMVRMMVGAIVEHATGKIPLVNIVNGSPHRGRRLRHALLLRPQV